MPDPEMLAVGQAIAAAIRRAARREGMTLRQFHRAKGLRNTAFFKLVRGEPPKSIIVVRQLVAAGLLSRSLIDRLLGVVPRDAGDSTLRRTG